MASSLQKNTTYELRELPEDEKTLKNKWVFKLKKDGNKLVKHKTGLVLKGFSQNWEIDFDYSFSSGVKMSPIQVILELIASLKLELEKLYLKPVFLHGDLEEEIYMDQSKEFEKARKE